VVGNVAGGGIVLQNPNQPVRVEDLHAAVDRVTSALDRCRENPQPRIDETSAPKGGTGKTTSTVNLSGSLAASGRVMLVDLDSQSSL
jgi:Mrp family chromosome partitioning ATPase